MARIDVSNLSALANENELNAAINAIIEQIERCGCPENVAEVVKKVRDLNRPAQLLRVTTALHRPGIPPACARVGHAQALINTGKLTRAIDTLRALEKELETAQQQDDRSETIGLLGRAYKQLYVDADPTMGEPREHDYQQALHYYRLGYGSDLDKHWHGINVVALLAHHERVVGANTEAELERRRLAAEITAKILPHRQETDYWKLASAMEANLALNDQDKALLYAGRFAYLAKSPFELASAIRQLTQLWKLDEDNEPGASILPLLRAALVKKGGEVIVPSVPEFHRQLSATKYERVYDDIPYKPHEWMKLGLDRARSVVQLGRHDLQRAGTGFLLSCPEKFSGKPMVITNTHTFEPYGSLPLVGARAVFTGLEGSPSFRIVAGNIISPPQQLDITILELEPAARGVPVLSAIGEPPGKDHLINIIGHPTEGGLYFSIRGNKVTDVASPYLRYRAPTNKGSSGSPIFDDGWNLVGVHHAEVPDANQGILWSEIVQHLS